MVTFNKDSGGTVYATWTKHLNKVEVDTKGFSPQIAEIVAAYIDKGWHICTANRYADPMMRKAARSDIELAYLNALILEDEDGVLHEQP